MPVMNEWEKSRKLTSDLITDIVSASLEFCFAPLSEIFEELYIQLAWDLYFIQTPPELYALYNENQELMGHLVDEESSFAIEDMGILPTFNREIYKAHHNWSPRFPITLPILSKQGRRYNSHKLEAPPEGNNKKQRALFARYEQLQKDIKVFREKIQSFKKELTQALLNCNTTKQFCEQNPEFEGYMKQSLKKFYNDKHPNVIDSLNSAMDVRKYASLTTGHRLQAYQQSMLTQLQPLESHHIPVLDTPQT